MLIHSASLSQTVDAVSASIFEQRTIAAAERKRAAQWLAARQGLPGAYADMFAGFPAERKNGIVVFTGERFTSASARHILGEEASRALRLLRVSDSAAKAALGRASDGMMRCLEHAATGARNNPGRYCCSKCTVGLWRNLLAAGLDRQEERLSRGVTHLRTMRDGKGRWRRFPFWYTVLALAEMDAKEASNELRYAAPLLARAARRAPAPTTHARRRHELARRALARV